MRHAWVGVVGGMLLLGGCKSARDQFINRATDTPEFHKKVVDKARSSCVEAANRDLPGRSDAVETTITGYCDCFAVKGLARFSNAELVDLGVRGMGSMTAEQKAKMQGAEEQCQAETMPKPDR